MEIGCIIQARMWSTRLPGKVLEELEAGKSCLEYVIQQLEDVFDIKNMVIATTFWEVDDVIEKFCVELGINVFRWEPKNVLDRYYNCAKEFSIQNIVRITSDCPLIDPSIVDKGISIFKNNNYDYVTNTYQRTYPDGNETEDVSVPSDFPFKNISLSVALLNTDTEWIHWLAGPSPVAVILSAVVFLPWRYIFPLFWIINCPVASPPWPI